MYYLKTATVIVLELINNNNNNNIFFIHAFNIIIIFQQVSE